MIAENTQDIIKSYYNYECPAVPYIQARLRSKTTKGKEAKKTFIECEIDMLPSRLGRYFFIQTSMDVLTMHMLFFNSLCSTSHNYASVRMRKRGIR